MELPVIPTAALFLLTALAIYHFIVYPIFFSPLSKTPSAHWSAPLSSLWILYHRLNQQDTPTVHTAHEKHGPIVRVAPNELSVNTVDGGIRTIYGGGFEKGDWYANAFDNYGIKPMFAMEGHNPHSKRKRMLSNVYAKSTLQNSETMAAISQTLLHERLVPRLQGVARSGNPTEAYELFSAVTMDFVNAYAFGLQNGSDFIRNPEHTSRFLKRYKARQVHIFWPQELPRFADFMKSVGLFNLLVPAWVKGANNDIEAWILDMCGRAESSLVTQQSDDRNPCSPADYPSVYGQLRNALLKESTKASLDRPISEIISAQRLEIASEMADHVLAGFDTSGITLAYLAWELSRTHNASWQAKLRSEILSLNGNKDPKTIDALPVLNACLMETLRLHAAIPGQQPRHTPAGAVLGTEPAYTLPAGVRVQSQAWSLHRNAAVFPSPENWHPQRWLDSTPEALKEMGRWFWAFSSGGRMCVGSNLAMMEMKGVMAAIWGGFRTSVVEDDGMRHNGGYLAEPLGGEKGWLQLRFESLDKAER